MTFIMYNNLSKKPKDKTLTFLEFEVFLPPYSHQRINTIFHSIHKRIFAIIHNVSSH